MRKVIYSVAMSLDGYIAGPNGEFDWIPDEPTIDWSAFMSRFDTVIMGHRTYMIIASQQQGAALPEMTTYVFSRTLQHFDNPQVTVVAKDAPDFVTELRLSAGKDIWLMGGGILFASLLDACLVDVVEIGLVPILLGGGIPMLAATAAQTRLGLTSQQIFPSGLALLSYDVVSVQ